MHLVKYFSIKGNIISGRGQVSESDAIIPVRDYYTPSFRKEKTRCSIKQTALNS